MSEALASYRGLVNPGETHAGGVRGEIGGSATGRTERGDSARMHFKQTAKLLTQDMRVMLPPVAHRTRSSM